MKFVGAIVISPLQTYPHLHGILSMESFSDGHLHMNSSKNKFALFIRKAEILLRVLNRIILALTIVSAIILGVALFFSINPELFEKAFIIGLVLIAPVVVLFYVATILFLFGQLEKYWVDMYPVGHGLLHWGIFIYGTSMPDAQIKLFGIVVFSVVLGVVFYAIKIHTKKLFLLILMIVYWLPSIDTFMPSLSSNIKIGVASILLVVSLLSFANKRRGSTES